MTVNIYYLSNQPIKGSAFSFIIGLYSQADTKLLQDNPTLAAGDVKVIKDGVYDNNIDALPVAITSITRALLATVSATENNCNYGGLVFHDVADAEWCDVIVYWSTVQAVGVGTADPGSQMDLVNAPNGTAITAIQNGLALEGADGDTLETLSDQIDNIPINTDAQLSAIHGDAQWGCCTGLGSEEVIYTVKMPAALGGAVIPGVTVWATTDLAGTDVVAFGVTDAFGKVIFWLDPGIYYIWRYKAGYYVALGEDPNPEIIVVV